MMVRLTENEIVEACALWLLEKHGLYTEANDAKFIDDNDFSAIETNGIICLDIQDVTKAEPPETPAANP